MVEEHNRPVLVMFAGPNGSGKSTVTPLFQSQPNFPNNYINPDEIALTLGGDTMSKAYEASAIAAQQRLEYIEQRQSFAFETVMSHPSKLAILETARAAGFEVQLVFVSTDNPQTNVDRVKQRVIEGGHDVPENKIRSRYQRSMSLLSKASEIADKTYIFDNSDASKLEAVLSQGQVIQKSENTAKWVENTIATLSQRQQEKSAIEQSNPNSSQAHLNKGQYSGKIESVSKHFTLQRASNGQAVIHENAILNLNQSAIAHYVQINYRHGVHKIDLLKLAIDTSQNNLKDTMFDLASSSKYLVLNRGTTDSSNHKIYRFPSGVTIEKSTQSLLISQGDKSLQFDRDFNIVQNSFSETEIRQLNQHTQSLKRHSIQQSQSQSQQQDRGLSL